MITYLGVQMPELMPTAKEILPVDENHRIKVYQHIGRNTLLYVPQYRHKTIRGRFMWFNYVEQVGNDGSWDTWATWDMDEAISKIDAEQVLDASEPGGDDSASWYEYKNEQEAQRQ